jgi:HSP20 family molecular chaperone IbpA
MNKSADLAKRETTTPTKSDGPKATQSPLVDVYENADELLLVADMPGVTPDELAIHVDRDELTIESHRTTATSDGKLLAAEFVSRDYRRSFTMPHGLDMDKVKAEFSNGILSLHLPKSPAVKPRQIQVRAG